ncbi:hypothetical protein ACQY1Q_03065 [Tenacibaculum sp. TC6]|uniref:hypothetical protein n=1 Tax=Tenacibaculum sp. TC6 TaxID=3423223 RepID=UPI003D361D62
MRNVYLIFLVVFSFKTLYAQEASPEFKNKTSEEDEIIDNLLNQNEADELFNLSDDLDFLYVSVDYTNNTYFAGRDIGINQFNVTPQLTYINSNGFFINISGVYYSQFTPKWDYTSVSLGYGNTFGKNEQYKWLVYYDRYFFSDEENNPFKNAFNVGFEVTNKAKTLGTELTSSILFGSENSIQLTSSTYGEIELYKNKRNELKLRPELRVTVGQQTIQLARTFKYKGREITVYNENNHFGLLNTQLLVPVQYSINNIDFELGYIVNFPSALEGESNLKITQTFAFSIAYMFDL